MRVFIIDSIWINRAVWAGSWELKGRMQTRSRLTAQETRSFRKRTPVEYSKELFGKAKRKGKKIFIESISEKYGYLSTKPPLI
jgi:hypothetical protein